MEQLTVHSKDYFVRWINIPAGHTISWSLTPKSHSVQFGLFKHPSGQAGSTSTLHGVTSSSSASNAPSLAPSNGETPKLSDPSKNRRASIQPTDAGATVQDKLARLGIRCVLWVGKCEADRVTTGHYDVGDGPGMYGLVFDNTYSKQLSKNITLVLMSYLTGAPPKSGHQLHFTQSIVRHPSGGSLRGASPRLAPLDKSEEEAPRAPSEARIAHEDAGHVKVNTAHTHFDNDGSEVCTGVLSKKRRKRNQGYARRFFSLDFSTATLSYYKNRNSTALRGAVPLSLAAIGVNEKSRQISIDSGAEIWLLRASNQKDFDSWRSALERASQTPAEAPAAASVGGATPRRVPDLAEEREWSQVESLVEQISNITSSVRSLAIDADQKQVGAGAGAGLGISSPLAIDSPVVVDAVQRQEDGATDAGAGAEQQTKPSFWRRKSSNRGLSRPTLSVANRSTSQGRLSPSPSRQDALDVPRARDRSASPQRAGQREEDLQPRIAAVMSELDKVVLSFKALITESRSRRATATPISGRAAALRFAEHRNSVDSTMSQEFYDALDGGSSGKGLSPSMSNLLQIPADEDHPSPALADDAASVSSSASSAYGDATTPNTPARISTSGTDAFQPRGSFPRKPKSYSPLPAKAQSSSISRRSNVPASTASPPSLISFLRKNVGKDLSTIAMPVSANEPLSLLQRQAENLEYSSLLDTAASATSAVERMLYVTAFAISTLSNNRDKSRATRKPFNPMLGETFELVREDRGYRFLAEKVSHRPVRVACTAESVNGWGFAQNPAPEQKFWGKSAELTTDGRCRVTLYSAGGSGEQYWWQPPTCFLRNVIAGEKYVEPVGNMAVLCEDNGLRSTTVFKAGGMFSGRSEEVNVSVSGPDGRQEQNVGLSGKWTSSLETNDGRKIWTAEPLVPDPGSHYGMTVFAATLNEITEMERGAVCPTDSRLRPDQRAYEDGDVAKAEDLKARLEEAQRRRRKDMEGAGEQWVPRWFERGEDEDGEEVWMVKGAAKGEEGSYWDVRAAVKDFKGGRWDGVRNVFET